MVFKNKTKWRILHYGGFLDFFDTLPVVYALYRVVIMYCTRGTHVK